MVMFSHTMCKEKHSNWQAPLNIFNTCRRWATTLILDDHSMILWRAVYLLPNGHQSRFSHQSKRVTSPQTLSNTWYYLHRFFFFLLSSHKKTKSAGIRVLSFLSDRCSYFLRFGLSYNGGNISKNDTSDYLISWLNRVWLIVLELASLSSNMWVLGHGKALLQVFYIYRHFWHIYTYTIYIFKII